MQKLARIMFVSGLVVAGGCGGSAKPVAAPQPVTSAAPQPVTSAAPQPVTSAAAPDLLRERGSDQTIAFVVQMTIKPENEAEFLAHSKAFIDKVYALEPGALTYSLVKHPTEPQTYVWIERYRDMDAVKVHASSAYLKEGWPKMKTWLAKPHVLTQYQQVAP